MKIHGLARRTEASDGAIVVLPARLAATLPCRTEKGVLNVLFSGSTGPMGSMLISALTSGIASSPEPPTNAEYTKT